MYKASKLSECIKSVEKMLSGHLAASSSKQFFNFINFAHFGPTGSKFFILSQNERVLHIAMYLNIFDCLE